MARPKFVSLLWERCSILSNDSDPESVDGQESRQVPDWDVVASDVPCRIDTNAIGRAEEANVDARVGLLRRLIYMEQPSLSNGQSLNSHHCILSNGVYYNVIDPKPAKDANSLDHLEVECQQLITLEQGEFGS
jgi:hypothetical protein